MVCPKFAAFVQMLLAEPDSRCRADTELGGVVMHLESEIGLAAGEVYRFLEKKGTSTLTQLRRELPLERAVVDQAVGWLARESKLSFAKDRRTTVIGLKTG